jgi:hypothetical protein
VPDTFLPPPIPADQLRELQRAIAVAAIDRMLDQQRASRAAMPGADDPVTEKRAVRRHSTA